MPEPVFMRCLALAAQVGAACALLLGLAAATPAQAARVALVIGNAAYAVGPLRNPVNDARAMDERLQALGFRVQRVENLRRSQIGRVLSGFANSIQPGDEVVFFYAGHGFQVKGVNYMPAVDADIDTEDDVPLNSLNLNAVLERLEEARAGVTLVFMDACRNNPFARSFRSSDRGLARVASAPSGTLIQFATRPGRVAADGSGANGLYTSELLRQMDRPGVPVEIMLKRVTAAVEAASQGQQEPWLEGSIRGDFYFRPGSGAQAADAPASPRPQPAATAAPRPQPPAAAAGLDLKVAEAAVNQRFLEWSSGWFIDRYVPGSARVERKDCAAQACDVAGNFTFVRGGSRHTIPFTALVGGAGAELSVRMLCYADSTIGKRACTN